MLYKGKNTLQTFYYCALAPLCIHFLVCGIGTFPHITLRFCDSICKFSAYTYSHIAAHPELLVFYHSLKHFFHTWHFSILFITFTLRELWVYLVDLGSLVPLYLYASFPLACSFFFSIFGVFEVTQL